MEQQTGFAFDWLGGPVYRFEQINARDAATEEKKADRSFVIDVVVRSQEPGTSTEHRKYFALNLAQAIARAAELGVRLRELEVGATVVGIRPATDSERTAFFRAMDKLEAQMPEPIEPEGCEHPNAPVGDDRNVSTAPNCGQGQHPYQGGNDAGSDSDNGGDCAGSPRVGAGEEGAGQMPGRCYGRDR